MSDESQECICGHKKDEHQFGLGCLHEHGGEFCWCKELRPVLDWPDSEGWWWCSQPECYRKHQVVYAGSSGSEGVQVYDAIGDLWVGKERFEELYGAARFTKAEPNPFQEPPR